MARNRTRDPSDLAAFLWSSKGVAVVPAPLPYALFLDTQKGCEVLSRILHDACNAIYIHEVWSLWKMIRNSQFGCHVQRAIVCLSVILYSKYLW